MTQTQTIDLSTRYDPRRNSKQVEFHSAPETNKLYGGALGGGKTAALINESIQLLLDYPGNFGLLMRKTWPSFRDTDLPQLEKFMDRGLVADWNHSNKTIILINGSKLRYGGIGPGADDWTSFMGGEYGFIALDQAEEFSETEFRMLSTRLRLNLPGIRYYILLTCNPDPGWLKERFIEKNLPDHRFIPALPTDNLANLPPDYIEKLKQILDENQIKALLHGDWEAVGTPDGVYSYAKIKAAMTRKAERSLPVEIGSDVARSGDDETTIYLREGLVVIPWALYRGHDLMQTTGEIWRCVSERVIPTWGLKLAKIKIKVDADGLGAGVVDRLREQIRDKTEAYTRFILEHADPQEAEEAKKAEYRFRIEVIEIHGAGRSSEPIKFKNRRAEIHWSLREVLDDVALPDDRELVSQLVSIKYKINSAGQIEIVSKDDIKEKLGRSPDRAEGVLYTLADIKPIGPVPNIRSLR
jgi:hypothetical protein